MPYHDDKLTSKFQIHLSNYFFDSFFDTLVREAQLIFWARSSEMPSDIPINFTTTGLEKLFPGMVEKYGADLPVDVKFGLIQAEKFDSAEGNQTIHSVTGFQCTFFVQFKNGSNETAVDLKVQDIVTGFGLII